MFIPRGKIVHENLATSYVQVDALVADLVQGGFSGFVEVVLRDTDSFVVINSGNVAAVVENRGPDEHPGERYPRKSAFTSTTIEQLAERSRLQRGRVSIYGYSAATASAVAERINAQSLYAGLTTEFADLEKMIWKLVREQDREWFIEINTEGAGSALIHMRDGACRIFNSAEVAPEEESDALDLGSNTALRKLLLECNRPGTTFDVYFSRAAEATDPEADRITFESEAISVFDSVDTLENEAHVNAQAASSQRAASGPLARIDMNSSEEARRLAPTPLTAGDPESEDQSGGLYNARSAVANHPSLALLAEVKHSSDGASSPDPGWNLIEEEALDSVLGSEELPASADAEAMAEVKRLMGEIARTIEEAAQAVDRPDSFSMSLRAGQLKIADRYPFLDPFAGEIEYLTGEIVFVGQATAEEFIAGLTEALKLAVEAVMRSTAYADRFRAYVTEDLQKLLARQRPEFEKFGLDQAIEQIIRF
ncbi:MAG: hypothetical protein AABN33_03425 [Acidobacteriota bacterium]